MLPKKAESTGQPEHEVGKYLCPASKSLVPLIQHCGLADIRWPLLIEACPACGQQHLLRCEDVWHPPVFGFE